MRNYCLPNFFILLILLISANLAFSNPSSKVSLATAPLSRNQIKNSKIPLSKNAVNPNAPNYAYIAVKAVFDEMFSSNKMNFSVLDRILRLLSEAIEENMEANNIPSAESLCNEQIKILNKAGGIEKVVKLYRKNSKQNLQEKIDNRILPGYRFGLAILQSKGGIIKARNYLGIIKKYSQGLSKPLSEKFTDFNRLYTEDKDLIPLYQQFLLAGIKFDTALYITNNLSSVYREIKFKDAASIDDVIDDLKENCSILRNDIFGENDEINIFHHNIFLAFLGYDKAKQDLAEAMKANSYKKNYNDLFKCAYNSYLTYFILKAKGLDVKCILTKNVNALPDWAMWLERIGIINPRMIRAGHVLNLARLNDEFILVDLMNEYVSDPFFWLVDLLRFTDKKYSFFSDKEFIKNFEILEPKEALTILFSNFAAMLAESGLFDEAMFYFKRAVDLKPDFAFGYANLGYLMDELKKYDESREMSLKALEYDPDCSDAYINLSNLSFEKRNCADAIKYAKKAVEIDFEYAEANANLGGMIYNCNHDVVNSREFIKKAIALAERAGDISFAEKLRVSLSQMK